MVRTVVHGTPLCKMADDTKKGLSSAYSMQQVLLFALRAIRASVQSICHVESQPPGKQNVYPRGYKLSEARQNAGIVGLLGKEDLTHND